MQNGTRLFASACLDENACIETSKVSPLLLQVYTTYRCLHLTPIKEKKHPEEIKCMLSSALVSQEMCTEHRSHLESGRDIRRVFSLGYQFGR